MFFKILNWYYMSLILKYTSVIAFCIDYAGNPRSANCVCTSTLTYTRHRAAQNPVTDTGDVIRLEGTCGPCCV